MQALRLKSGQALRRALIHGGELTQGESAFSSVLRKVKTNLNDMRFFGPAIVRSHLKRHSADPRMTVVVPQVGTVHI
jgi:hypothetical protein